MSMARLLVIAGSDPSAGAGLQADLKTAFSFGVYAQTAITAVTVQNTLGASAVHPLAPAVVRAQIAACLSDIGADAIKIGMLGTAPVAAAVADALTDFLDKRAVPLVLDPVIMASAGVPLLDDEGVGVLLSRLAPRAMLVTPNLPEAERLMGFFPSLPRDAVKVVNWMGRAHVKALLIKGGHAIAGGQVNDALFTQGGIEMRTMPAVDTRHTHGTGCTLSTAIACRIAQGLALGQAVRDAQDYVHRALMAAPGLGAGHGPLGHHTARP